MAGSRIREPLELDLTTVMERSNAGRLIESVCGVGKGMELEQAIGKRES